MTDDLWVLPKRAGTVIAIGGWWLVKLEPWEEAGPDCWELLPARSAVVRNSFDRAGVKAQCVYSDDWVLAEAQQEGGYYVISEPVARPYGPTIRRMPASTTPDVGNDSEEER